MRPGLVSIAAGGNDMLRPGADPDMLAESFDAVIQVLEDEGLPVLMFTGFDPRFPVLRLIRGKVAAFNMHLRAIADSTTATWWIARPPGVERRPAAPHRGRHEWVALRRARSWACRLHEDWREPCPALGRAPQAGALTWLEARRLDARWAPGARGALAGPPDPLPVLRGGIPPKRPELLPVTGPARGSAGLPLDGHPQEHRLAGRRGNPSGRRPESLLPVAGRQASHRQRRLPTWVATGPQPGAAPGRRNARKCRARGRPRRCGTGGASAAAHADSGRRSRPRGPA